jgi:hypothetical protein
MLHYINTKRRLSLPQHPTHAFATVKAAASGISGSPSLSFLPSRPSSVFPDAHAVREYRSAHTARAVSPYSPERPPEPFYSDPPLTAS